MSAIAGIKSELSTRRQEREDAAKVLDATNKTHMAALAALRRDQKRVDFISDRIEALHKALKDLGGTDDEC